MEEESSSSPNNGAAGGLHCTTIIDTNKPATAMRTRIFLVFSVIFNYQFQMGSVEELRLVER